jgi:hypothetical protein
VVESPCCGDVWCWQCAVERPALDAHCPCGRELALEDFRPAKAIQALLKRAATSGGVVWPRPYAEIAHDDLLPCPESCGAVVRADGVEDHLATCGEVAQPCPNDCYARGLKRKDVAAHLSDECPLASVPCRFGCDETILRREMEDHMKDNVALHLEQLHATVEAQKTQIAQLVNERQMADQAPPKRRRCMSHFDQRVGAMVVLYLVAVLVLVGVPLMAKLVVVAGAMIGLHWGFKRWAGRLRMPRSPFNTAETNLLFALLCTAIFFSLCPLYFLRSL